MRRGKPQRISYLSESTAGVYEKLLLVNSQRLNIYSLLNLITTLYRVFNKSLSASKLADGSGLLEFTLEFLQRSFNIFALFYWYYNHAKTPPFFRTAKVGIIFIPGKFTALFL